MDGGKADAAGVGVVAGRDGAAWAARDVGGRAGSAAVDGAAVLEVEVVAVESGLVRVEKGRRNRRRSTPNADCAAVLFVSTRVVDLGGVRQHKSERYGSVEKSLRGTYALKKRCCR